LFQNWNHELTGTFSSQEQSMSRQKKTPENKQLQSDVWLVSEAAPAPDKLILAEVEDLTLAMRQLMQVPTGGSSKS